MNSVEGNTLPKGWVLETLGTVVELENGDRGKNYPSKKTLVSEGVPFINTGHLEGNKISKSKITYITEKHFERLGSGKIKVNDILFCLRGSLGKFALNESITKGAIASSLVIIRVKEELLNCNYLSFYLNSNIASDMIKEFDNGSAQPNLSSKNLKLFLIPLPPLQEQKHIVTKIDTLFAKIDTAITLTEESLKQAKNLLPSVLNEVFETIDGEEKFLPELVKEGRYSIKRGPFGSSLKKQFFVPSGYKVYEQKHAIRDDFEIGEYFVNEEKYLELKAFDLKPRDIIISCSGTVGRIAVAPDNLMPGIINQALLKISLNEDEIEIPFFTYWFNNYVNNGSLSTKGAAIKNIVSVKELKAIPIKVPTLNSQNKICNQFDRYSQLSKQTQSKLEEQLVYLKQLKSSILSKAFKGEL